MGSVVTVAIVGSLAELGYAEQRIHQLEQRWSRFRPTSEISGLNRHAGTPLRVSADTVELVERSIEGWRLTAGRFDPTVLGAVIDAGYDRSFDDMATERIEPLPVSLLGRGCDRIRVDGDEVTLPFAVGFDPGGIGKGLAADIVCRELRALGADGVCVNVGGDVRVSGIGPGGGGWTVAVEHPGRPAPVALIGLSEGAVATSTTLLRQWVADGRSRHHLIDPFTGLPAHSAIELASVVSRQCWHAEVMAKTLIVARGDALTAIAPSAAEALTVTTDRVVHRTPGLDRYLAA